MIDPRQPVIVGVGQRNQHVDDVLEALEPVDLFVEAARAAEADAHAARSLLDRVDTIAVAAIGSWNYPDPGALAGRRLGVEPKETIVSTVGGNSPQMLLLELADRIQSNTADIVLIGGAECMLTRQRARREPKQWLQWTVAEDPPCPNVLGDTRFGTSEHELAHGLVAPVTVYPLFETALRHGEEHDVDEHQRFLGSLQSRFAQVAAGNEHAWTRTAFTGEQISTVSADNRVVAFPYLKRMCADINVDQAAAIVMCSYETARAHGVPDDRMVFPWSGAEAHDHFFVTERESLSHSVAIRIAGAAAMDASSINIDDVARFDLYSCFPSAVTVAAHALGLSGPFDERPLTTSGGLAFAGGPVNNYSTHGIATMVDACREDPGSIGLVTALGWYVTKHAIGIYSARPPWDGFIRVPTSDIQPLIDRKPKRAVAGPFSGQARVEATSVTYDRDGDPEGAMLTLVAADGSRVLARCDERDAMLDMVRDDGWEGRTLRVTTDGSTNKVLP